MSQKSVINQTIANIYSLTPLQEGMLYHKLDNGQSTSYVIQNRFEVSGDVSEETIKQALKLLITRHEVLKTSIVYEKLAVPRQVILRNREAEFEMIDLSGLNEAEQTDRYAEIARQDVERGFDLQHDSLLRIKLVVLGDPSYKMIWTYHHIIMDGWCLSLLYGDFKRYYKALRSGRSMAEMERLVAAEKQQTAEYGEYVKWLEQQDHELGLSYWEDLLSDYDETAEIQPMRKPAPVSEQVARTEITISPEKTQSLLDLAASQQITINTVAETAWGIVLQTYSGTRDVVFGKIVSGRQADVRGIEQIVGLFINTLPARVRCTEEMTVSELLKEIQMQGTKGNDYAYCSFSEILGLTQQKADLVKNLYVFENYTFDEDTFASDGGELELKVEASREQTNYGITLIASLVGGTLHFKIMYNPNLYVQDEIDSILTRLETVLQAFSANPEGRVSEIETITEQEKAQIIGVFNDTTTVYRKDKTVVELFEEQVRKTPEKTAVVVGEDQLTYAELNQKANQLAGKIRELGVKPDDFVAILAERRIETIIGICGILKAGGAYLPIDPTNPQDRIDYMLEDAKPKALLAYDATYPTDLPLVDLSDAAQWAGVAENLPTVNQSDDLIYVIYTSGTTGKPKGVMVEHKSVLRLVDNVNYVTLNENTVILQTGALSFDASTFEIWGALLHGGRVFLAEKDVILDAERLKKVIEEQGITTMFTTTALFNQLMNADEAVFDGLNTLLFGGEKTSELHVRKLAERNLNIEFANIYGPTETTTFATWCPIEAGNLREKTPIGKPISNTQVYVVNEGKLCGIGIAGELCIAGDGVARGYLNRPELTVEKFVDNPFAEGRMYRTGDLVRWLPDGNIEYLGRIDQQIKIRGFRMELGEIEHAIRQQEGVRDAVVIVNEEAEEKRLCAYIVLGPETDISRIREELRKQLPEYMIPASMMSIEKIPVTRNGKVDKKALPQIEIRSEHEYVAPHNELEAVLCDVFAQVLGAQNVGVKDSFFELGGDSIKAIRIVSKMRSAGYSLSVKDIMSKYTVEGIAYAVVAASGNHYEQNEVTGKIIATPIMQEFASWNLPKPHHFNQDMMLEIDLDDEVQIQKVLTAVAIHHDIIRSVYREGSLEILSSSESPLYEFKAFDLRDEDQVSSRIEGACTDLHSSIDLEQGPLMKAALFRTAEGNLLFLCLHHLVVDGVSWRILLEDVETAIGQVKAGKKISLPAKTASFKEWSEALDAYKNSRQLQQERSYWENVTSAMLDGRIALEESTDETGHATLVITLSEEETDHLIHRAGKAFNTEINDLLISAIGQSVKKLTGQAVVSIELEGHGREEILQQIDIDRTIGWFTTQYPIVVACQEDCFESIIQTKEMLRKVPNRGLGYGLLKNELQPIPADLSFNYLGQMDAESKDSKATFFSTGKSSATENITPGKISFNGYVSGGVLSLVLAYDRSVLSEGTMEKFAALYKESLVNSIAACIAQKETVKTPSDYSTSNLTGKDLSVIRERFENTSWIEDIYSLTPLQEGMLYHNIADKNSTGYVIQSMFSLRGEVDEAILQQALQLLAIRHDVLRTTILYEKLSKPRQVLLYGREVEVESTDLTGLSEQEQEQKIVYIAGDHVKRGFDLQHDPLLRVHYIALSPDRHKLIWTYHHIILDGWCLSLLYGDFNRYYRLLKNGSSLSDLKQMVLEEKKQTASYGEYLQWMEQQDRAQGLSYWEELLADYDETTEIKPVMKLEATEQQVMRTVVEVSAETGKKLLQTAASHQLTVNTLVEAAWGLVLQAYSGTKDVVFGKVVSGRNANVRGIEQIVGLFINTIPTRVRCTDDMTVLELWKELQKQGTESDLYSYCSLAEIQSLSQQKSELIKVLYAFENYFIDEEKLKVVEGGLQFEIESAREQTNYDITLGAYQSGETLIFDLLYNPNVYAPDEIRSILERIEVVLQAFAANPAGKVSAIEAITERELVQILGEFNATAVEYARDQTVVDLFEEQVRIAPDRIAVVFADQQLTYAELNHKVNQVAWKLRQLGVQPDDRVAILAERSIEMIAGIYGIMKAGGAYVPIDPTFPEDRIRFMLQDCQSKAVLLYRAELVTELPVLDLSDGHVFAGPSENPEKVNKPDDLAYVIYTSGTTGQPKGVMLQHRGVASMRSYLKELYQVTEQDNVLQFANYVFDAAVWEMTISLLNGARLTLVAKEIIADLGSFNEFVNQSGITITLLPPQFYLQTQLIGLEVLTTGGSASNAEIITKAGSQCRYVNAYGPTENTVLATHWEYDGASDIPHPIPIGRPISNSQIYILDGLKLCGIGVPGELCIAGDGLARGYLNKPELTAEKFIANPFGEGRLYRSGDLARWLPDGNIEYLGRIDEQEKIRGFRIELGEIESALRKWEHIVDAAVIARKDPSGEKALHAFVVSDVEINTRELKDALRGVLPDYMIPAFLMQIDSLPFTRSGKLDKNALPMPDLELLRQQNRFVAAQNEREHELTVIWKSILPFEEIGIHDNFFDLGGNSLLISVMLAQIEEKYPGIVKVGDLFANPTIAQLAAHIESNSLGTLRCTQISFPDAYFKQSNKGLQHSVFRYIDEGSLSQSIQALQSDDESELYARLLFAYSYLLFDATGQQELAVCTVREQDYRSFDVQAEEDLNVLMEVVRQKDREAPKFQRAKLRIESKEKGLMPIFLYRFSGNDFYKNDTDFSLSFQLEEGSVTFAAEVFNKKISEHKIEELLRGFVQIVQHLIAPIHM